nr:hypothetical protein [Tanacetum cinerariifolium]
MESLGSDTPGSALAVKSVKASCPDADSECKMKKVDQVAFSSSSLASETMIGSSVGESGVKKADLVSFKKSAKSSSFTFCKMSSAPDSLFALDPADVVLSTRTLGLDPTRSDTPGSALAMKSVKASCPDADSECKMKKVDQVEFLDLPHLASSAQEKLKTLNSLPVTTTGVPLVDKANASPVEGEKDVDTKLKNKLVDLLGIDIVTQYYNKKLHYEKYYESMKKRRQSTKIINSDVLTIKGPISLK